MTKEYYRIVIDVKKLYDKNNMYAVDDIMKYAERRYGVESHVEHS